MHAYFKLFLFISLLAPKAWAVGQNGSHLVWHDASGFESVMGCEILPQTVEFTGRLRDLADQELFVSHTPLAAHNSPFELKGSVWQSVRDESGRLTFLRCPMGLDVQDYLLFNVYPDGAGLPAAQVGITETDLGIFDTPSQSVSSFVAGIQAIEGNLDHVVCVSDSRLNVRDEALSKVIFTVSRFDEVKPVQSWDQNKQKKVIGGKTYTFIKAQFPKRSSKDNIGWVAEEYVMPKAKCPGLPQQPETPVEDANTWVFPTIKRTSSNYKSGMRAFKASRGGGSRSHAACDLYRVKDEQALSVYGGTVVRDRYYFYEGTYAIEVRHTGGKVVRYGEITGKAASGVAKNRTVRAGQNIGYIGKVNSGCCTPMLHFEMYAGTASGSLTQSGNKFQRRKDLLDPSAPLTQWEKAKFGTAY